MATLVFGDDTVGYQQQQQQGGSSLLRPSLSSEGPAVVYYGGGVGNGSSSRGSRDELMMDDENMNNFSSDPAMEPIFAKSYDGKGIRIGKFICCPSSTSLMTMFMFLIFAMWIIPYLLIIILLVVCGIDVKVSTAISHCGTYQHHLRPMFVATFCVNGVLFSIVFMIRALVLYVKWFGWKRRENTNNMSRWRKIFTCQFSNFKFPGRREILSVPFWLIILQMIPGIAANILLIFMAIYPDDKATRTEHFITAFLGLLLLVIYTGFSFIIQAWRLFRLCRGKTQPFYFIRRVNSLTTNKRRMYLLSVSGLSLSMVYHLFCMVGAIICIPIYLTKFIPIAEWIAVLLILLGMVPLMFDNMMSIKEGPIDSDEIPDTLLK